jgi:hypothetical protein
MTRIGTLLMAVCAIFTVAAGAVVWADEGEEAPMGWKKELVGAFNLTQASFDNWAQGGEATLGWQAGLNGTFTHFAPGHEWANGMKLAYGMTKVGDDDARKSVDEIKLESVYTYKAGFFFDPYVAATAATQFSKGYEYTDSDKTAISDFLDPGYFTQSAGVRRSYKDIVKTRIGAAIKETITDKFAVPYADDPETDEIEDTKTEVGAESVTDLNLKLSESLLFTSKLELFSNLEATNEVDINWDNLLTAKIEEYLSVNLNVRIFYDRDISTSRQIKEALAIGLTYSFI